MPLITDAFLQLFLVFIEGYITCHTKHQALHLDFRVWPIVAVFIHRTADLTSEGERGTTSVSPTVYPGHTLRPVSGPPTDPCCTGPSPSYKTITATLWLVLL